MPDTVSTLTYLLVKDVLPEPLQGLGCDVVLLHGQPLPHCCVCVLSHPPLVGTSSLWVGMQAFVQTVPLPHFLKGEGPEAALTIDSPVHIDLQVAGNGREQLHILQEMLLHPLVVYGPPLRMTAIKETITLHNIVIS